MITLTIEPTQGGRFALSVYVNRTGENPQSMRDTYPTEHEAWDAGLHWVETRLNPDEGKNYNPKPSRFFRESENEAAYGDRTHGED